jgi:hypothetical protein
MTRDDIITTVTRFAEEMDEFLMAINVARRDRQLHSLVKDPDLEDAMCAIQRVALTLARFANRKAKQP